MASLNFIKGTLKGRVGQFVGSSWRGKEYIKTFTRPGNPRTPNQVAVRSIFRQTANIAKGLYRGVLLPYTFPKPQKMTAYNRMIQINQPMFYSKDWDLSKLKIFEGPLFNPGIENAIIENPGTANESLFFQWNNSPEHSNDIAIPIVYDAASASVLFTVCIRSTTEVNVPTGVLRPVDPTKIHAYLVFAKPPAEGTGETGMVSGTAYRKI